MLSSIIDLRNENTEYLMPINGTCYGFPEQSQERKNLQYLLWKKQLSELITKQASPWFFFPSYNKILKISCCVLVKAILKLISHLRPYWIKIDFT